MSLCASSNPHQKDPITLLLPQGNYTETGWYTQHTVNLQNLNRECLRETHHTPPPFHLVNQMPRNMYKTVLDAKDGYHSIELDESSRDLTTFIIEWGKYQYRHDPQSFTATGDFYTRCTDEIMKDFRNKVNVLTTSYCITRALKQPSGIHLTFNATARLQE